MYNSRLLDNKTVTVKASDVTTRVSESNLVDFVGVQPNLALSAFQDGGGEALLELKRDCGILIITTIKQTGTDMSGDVLKTVPGDP